jgi:4'-phosphopantetheinyl transferase
MTPLARPAREVHLWRLHLEPPSRILAQLAETLSPEEQERAARFHFAIHRQRFVAGRGLLRAILAGYLGLAPAAVTFAYGPQGKPHLKDDVLQFNLSHSNDLGLLGITDLPTIGVDVEHIRPLQDLQAMARRFFAPGEVKRLLALPALTQEAAFFRCWTRKEALIKALGTGLSMPLDSFEVAFVDDETPRLCHIGGDEIAGSSWALRAVEVGSGAVAALAVPEHDWRLVEHGTVPPLSPELS